LIIPQYILHTPEVSSDEEEFPSDPEDQLFLGGPAGLPANTGLLNIDGEVGFCAFTISDGLKFPFSVCESNECFFGGPLGIDKCSEFGLPLESTECFLVRFSRGGGMLGFGGLLGSNECVIPIGRRVG